MPLWLRAQSEIVLLEPAALTTKHHGNRRFPTSATATRPAIPNCFVVLPRQGGQ